MTTSNVSNVFKENIKIKRALISVTDKSNIDILAQKLVSFNIEILSTGGTAKFLKDKSIPVTDVDQKTNFPEIFARSASNSSQFSQLDHIISFMCFIASGL